MSELGEFKDVLARVFGPEQPPIEPQAILRPLKTSVDIAMERLAEQTCEDISQQESTDLSEFPEDFV